MRLSVLLAVTLVAFASMASAEPIFPTCIAGGTMASYEALGVGGCVIGDKLFNNFSYSSTGSGTATAVPDSLVFLTPVDAGTYSPGPGIVFSSNNWVVPGSTTVTSILDMSFRFTVTVLPGGHLIDDASLTLGNFNMTGNGTGNIGESLCNADCSAQLGRRLDVSAGGQLFDETSFAGTNTVVVQKNFSLAVPRNSTGSISVSSFTENFSEIPEPVGAILIGSGLLALGAWRRRGSRG